MYFCNFLTETKKHISLIGLLIYFLGHSSSGQNLISYNTNNGLPSNHVYSVIQDDEGFIWMATNRGLVKFNGEEFKIFTVSDGLPNNDIYYLELDSKGRIWCLSKSKFQVYVKDNKIHRIPNSEDKVLSPNLFHRNKDVVWVPDLTDTYQFGNDTLQKTAHAKSVYRVKARVKSRYNTKRTKIPIFPIPGTTYTVGAINKKLLFFNALGGTFDSIPIELETFSHGELRGYRTYLEGVMFIPFEEGVQMIDIERKKSSVLKFSTVFNIKETLHIHCFNRHGEIRISIPGHTAILDSNFKIKEILHSPKEINDHFVFKDKDQNLWYYRLGEGVHFKPGGSNRTLKLISNAKVLKAGFYNGDLTACISENGEVKYVARRKNTFIPFINIRNGKSAYKLDSSVFVADNGSYICHTDSLEYFKLRLKNSYDNDFYLEAYKDIVKAGGHIYAIASERLFIMDSNKSLIYNPIDKIGLTKIKPLNDKVFIGGSDGLFVLKEDRLLKPETGNPLIDLPVSYLHDYMDHLVVGTDGGGLYFFKNKTVIPVPATQGLILTKIIRAKEGDGLWLATQNGIKLLQVDKADPGNSKITDQFYTSDGLLEDNINDIVLGEDTLYVASDMGLVALPYNHVSYKKKPIVYFQTDSNKVFYDASTTQNIQIKFFTLEYAHQKHLKFFYRLLPDQQEWVSTETKNLNFTGLSPANYTLEVKVVDHHGNEGLAQQYIAIIPAWHQTKLAIIIQILAALAILTLLMRILQNRLKKKEEREREIISMQLKVLRSQMNPHFIHNSLNAIQYHVQRNEAEISEEYLSRFSSLIRQFFEFSRKETIPLKDEIDLLHNYLKMEHLRFEDKLQFDIEVDERIDVNEYYLPSMILQPIVENAVNHGIIHKDGNGKVLLKFIYKKESEIEVHIQDDGIGIEEAVKIDTGSRKNYQSRSSQVIKERIELISNNKEWDITYKVEDLAKQNRGQTGTLVKIAFNQLIT